MGTGVGAAVGPRVGGKVGPGVGISVGPEVGTSDGSGVGANVSAGVGTGVDSGVGAVVSTASVVMAVDTTVSSAAGIVDVPCTISVGTTSVEEVVDGLAPRHMKQNSMNRICLQESPVDGTRQESVLIGATSFPSPAVRL